MPSSVVTVMVASPSATAVTTPSVTVATLSLLEDQVIFLFVALAGATVASRVAFFPYFSSRVVLSSLTPVTAVVPPLEV